MRWIQEEGHQQWFVVQLDYLRQQGKLDLSAGGLARGHLHKGLGGPHCLVVGSVWWDS